MKIMDFFSKLLLQEDSHVRVIKNLVYVAGVLVTPRIIELLLPLVYLYLGKTPPETNWNLTVPISLAVVLITVSLILIWDKFFNKNSVSRMMKLEPGPLLSIKLMDDSRLNLKENIIEVSELDDDERKSLSEYIKEEFPVFDKSEYLEQAKNKKEEWVSKKSHTAGGTLNSIYLKNEYRFPTESEIEEYIDDKYPAWIESVEAWVSECLEIKKITETHVAISFELMNDGLKPAEGLVVSFRIVEGACFAHTNGFSIENGKLNVELPKVPSYPEPSLGKIKLVNSGLTSILESMKGFEMPDSLMNDRRIDTVDFSKFASSRDNSRDDSKFYYGKNEKDLIEFSCKSFRHRYENEPFELLIELDGGNSEKVAIEVVVHAMNSQDKIVELFEFPITMSKSSIYEELKKELFSIMPC